MADKYAESGLQCYLCRLRGGGEAQGQQCRNGGNNEEMFHDFGFLVGKINAFTSLSVSRLPI
jgi:hypothetical protein